MKLWFSCLLLPLFSLAQMPESDVWLFQLKPMKGALLPQVVAGMNISHRAGYDNQPCFTADSKKLIYSSARDNQNDLYVYTIRKKTTLPLHLTPESEFSPTVYNASLFSVVVEKDSTQTIHRMELEKGTTTAVLAPDSVGYYTWQNDDTLLYYKLTAPHSLWAYSLKRGEEWCLASNPTRAFRALSRTQFIYAIKDSGAVVFLEYDFLLHKAKIITRCEGAGEDFVWHPVMGIVRPKGSTLLYYDAKEQLWKQWCDLSGFGVKHISRITFSSDGKQLAISDIQ